jgi:hypothetical protein
MHVAITFIALVLNCGEKLLKLITIFVYYTRRPVSFIEFDLVSVVLFVEFQCYFQEEIIIISTDKMLTYSELVPLLVLSHVSRVAHF